MHEMTAANLRSAFGGESMAHMRYKIWAERAAKDGFANVARLFRAISAEKIHAEMYAQAKEAVDGGEDVQLGPMQICNVCGYTAEGETPEYCPICGAKKDRFQTFA